MEALKEKASGDDRNAINMENVELTQDFRSLKSGENSLRSATSVFLSLQYVCILVLQHQGSLNG